MTVYFSVQHDDKIVVEKKQDGEREYFVVETNRHGYEQAIFLFFSAEQLKDLETAIYRALRG